MFTDLRKKKVPLQRYWTTRYLATLVIGLLVVTLISAWWIKHTTFENRLNMMRFMAEETANQIVHGRAHMDEESLLAEIEVKQFLHEPGRFLNMNSNPAIYVVNEQGNVLYSNSTSKTLSRQLNPKLLYSEEAVNTFYSEEQQDTLYMVKQPIATENNLIGWVVLFELKGNLTEVDREYTQLVLVIGLLAVLGWLAIYMLSRRLAKPIADVASAAEKVRYGDYKFSLPENIREKEVYELIDAFEKMAMKLEHLETLRTELLAGVTHELKTPVTSISGLIQAVKDGVVEGEEAQAFLTSSLEQTAKLQRMVDDLLAFNTFVTGAVPVVLKENLLNDCIHKMVHEWKMAKESEWKVSISPLSNDVPVQIDEVRLQQILTNLLNNALQSMKEKEAAEIRVVLGVQDHMATVDIIDQGSGIPEEEQSFIFERFYRGENKKFQVSGFGLGLPFSKMLAQAMDGDLILLHSSPDGTTFRLQLPAGFDSFN